MKKILITGAGSYIGSCVEKWLAKWPEEYQTDTIDMVDGTWKAKSFADYDTIFHIAGIAHIKETKMNSHLFFEVNEDLAVATAEKAKNEGVKQFIILSTMSVYGITTGHISKSSQPHPTTSYGESKYNADLRIAKMADDFFKVAILRPPMVYGKSCKGNYQSLRKFALKSFVFPSLKNQRSMIYINNLAEFVKQLIDRQASGLFFPQNAEYVNIVDMVKIIADYNGKKIRFVGIFNPIIQLGIRFGIEVFKKVFGNLTYEKCDCVSVASFDESIKETELQA